MINLSNIGVMIIPTLVAITGGVLAMIWRPSRQASSLIQHFAAGVVLSALAVEVLPEISREHAPPLVLITAFALGSFFMYAMKIWTDYMERREHQKGQNANGNTGLIIATFVDVAVDGLIIGAGFAAAKETGTILALGLSVELLFLGLALTSDTVKGWRILWLTVGIGLTVLVTALLGHGILSQASHATLGAALAFSAAALLYLVTDELLIEAHEVEETAESTLVLFAGFLVFWAIQLYGS